MKRLTSATGNKIRFPTRTYANFDRRARVVMRMSVRFEMRSKAQTSADRRYWCVGLVVAPTFFPVSVTRREGRDDRPSSDPLSSLATGQIPLVPYCTAHPYLLPCRSSHTATWFFDPTDDSGDAQSLEIDCLTLFRVAHSTTKIKMGFGSLVADYLTVSYAFFTASGSSMTARYPSA